MSPRLAVSLGAAVSIGALSSVLGGTTSDEVGAATALGSAVGNSTSAGIVVSDRTGSAGAAPHDKSSVHRIEHRRFEECEVRSRHSIVVSK
jgi:hypothetical protein